MTELSKSQSQIVKKSFSFALRNYMKLGVVGENELLSLLDAVVRDPLGSIKGLGVENLIVFAKTTGTTVNSNSTWTHSCGFGLNEVEIHHSHHTDVQVTC